MALGDIVPWRWGGLRRWEKEQERPSEGLVSQMDALHRDLPQVDETEDDKAYYVSVDLPGMDEEDVDVMVTDHSLTIRGEKKEEEEQKGKDYYRRERSRGAFRRVVELPVEVDQSQIEARFKKGVLRVTLPKTREAQEKVRHIPVKAA